MVMLKDGYKELVCVMNGGQGEEKGLKSLLLGKKEKRGNEERMKENRWHSDDESGSRE